MSMRLSWNGPQAKAATKRGAARGLRLWAEHVLEEANRIVPIQESTLLKSGTVSVDEGALRAAVSYDTPYAVRQHEELDYHHDAGRQAKYLEMPLNASQQTGQALVSREINKALGR
jgi:hypothetical protein